MCLIRQDGFWVVHVTFVRMVKFQFLAQFAVEKLPYQSCLILYSFCANNEFFRPNQLVVIHLGKIESKSPQIFSTLLSIQA